MTNPQSEPKSLSVIARTKDDLLNALKAARELGATRIDGSYMGEPLEISEIEAVEGAP